jgi:hypothetical protein
VVRLYADPLLLGLAACGLRVSWWAHLEPPSCQLDPFFGGGGGGGGGLSWPGFTPICAAGFCTGGNRTPWGFLCSDDWTGIPRDTSVLTLPGLVGN